MKNFDRIKAHLNDNTGDENISKLIWIVIVFVVGAIMLAVFTTVFGQNALSDWFRGNLNNLLNGTDGNVNLTEFGGDA